MNSGGYKKLSELLYSDSFDLQVNQRRRARKSGIFNVPANGTLNFTLSIGLLDSLITGDAFLFELLSATFLGAGPGLTITQATVSLKDSAGGIYPLQQPTITLFQVPTLDPVQINLIPNLQLLTAQDLGLLLESVIGPLPSSFQPINVEFAGTVSNSTAGVLAIAPIFFAFWRLVRGLQEN